jgi:hypothetical protein
VSFNISLILIGAVSILWGRRWFPNQLGRIRLKLTEPARRARFTDIIESPLMKTVVIGAQVVGLVFLAWGIGRVLTG